ncbi:hypothetical protein ES704_03019 [subsurface metagenome]
MILKAELIKVVNDTLKRNYAVDGTELDAKITSALKDLSKRGNFLTEESERKTIAERAFYSMPDHYKDRLLIMIDDYYPLGWETFKNYQEEISLSTDTGPPRVFCKMNKFYYLRPTPDSADYTIRQFFACYHPEKITVDGVEHKACDHILFNDIYRRAIEMRLIWEVAIGLGQHKTASDYMNYYVRDEVTSLLNNIDEDPVVAEYPDE